MNTNQEKLSIIRGAAVGTALGYAVALRFGTVIGMLVGLTAAVITSDLPRFIRAQRETRKEFGPFKEAVVDICKGVYEGTELYLGAQIPRVILAGLKTISVTALIVITTCSAKTLWNYIFCTRIDPNLEESFGWDFIVAGFFINLIGFFAIIAVFDETFCDLRKSIRGSGPLAFPLTKTIIERTGIFFYWLETREAKKPSRIRTYVAHFIDEVGPVMENWSRKETIVNKKVVIFVTALSLVFFALVFLMPILSIPIGIICGILAAALVLDVFIMIAVHCATTTTMAAGIGAATAIFIECRMYRKFSVHSTADWVRFVAFMVIGAAVGLGSHALRKKLLERKLQWV